jgi:hypothetical protein
MSDFANVYDDYKKSFQETGYQPAEEDQISPAEETSSYPQEELAAEEQTQTSRKKRSANSYKKRIYELTSEKGEAEQTNYFLAQQLAEKDSILANQQAKLQEFEQKLAQKDQYVNANYENNLLTKESSIKSELRKAKEDGDVDSEIELQDQLAEVKALKATHDLWKFQQAQQAELQQQQLENEPYVPYETPLVSQYAPRSREPQIDEDTEEWLDENQWYQTNPTLKAQADTIANELANILTYNNQAHMIGTPHFRQSITNLMNDEYGLQQGPHEQEETYHEEQYYQPKPAVAPVTRRGMSMADQYMNRNQNANGRFSTLSKEEYNIARHLPSTNKSSSQVDLARRYEKAKRYPASPHPGGTPNRLTIL